jgi:hypothetical protein
MIYSIESALNFGGRSRLRAPRLRQPDTGRRRAGVDRGGYADRSSLLSLSWLHLALRVVLHWQVLSVGPQSTLRRGLMASA